MRIENLSVGYGDINVLDKLTLDFGKTGVVLISAPSGFGKTTLFKAISGILPVRSGKIDGYNSVSYAFQEPRLLMWLSALENVVLVDANSSTENAQSLLLKLGLSREDLDKKASDLSGGMKQRVNIARAFNYDADVVLLDEPFASLDKANIDKVVELINDYRAQKLIVVISHEAIDKLEPDSIIHLNEV